MATDIDYIDHLTDVYSEEALVRASHVANKSADFFDDEQTNSSKNSNDNWDLFKSPLQGDNLIKSVFGGSGFLPLESFTDPSFFVSADPEYLTYKDVTQGLKF